MSKIYPSFWYLTPFHSIGWYLAVLILCAIIRDTDIYWLGHIIAVDWYANLWLLPIVDRWPFHFGLWFYHVRLHACLLPMVHLLVKHIVMIGCAQHHRKCLSQKARPNSCLLLTTHGAALNWYFLFRHRSSKILYVFSIFFSVKFHSLLHKPILELTAH